MTEGTDCTIGIGSNLGDRQAACEEAVRRIARFQKTSMVTVSSLYETAPMEITDQCWFLNCVAAIRTELPARDLLQACLQTEQAMGRERKARYGPRTIDLDILFYGSHIVREADLVIPHPKAHERRFVMEPLAEIMPDFIHPALHQTAAEILKGIQAQEIRRSMPMNLNRILGGPINQKAG